MNLFEAMSLADLEQTIRNEHQGMPQRLIPATVRILCACGALTRMVGDWDEERAIRLHERHVQDMVDAMFGTGLRS